jgi:23S rRNA (uracil1939-C5)-methyltransferase
MPVETPKVEQTLDVSIEKLVYGGEGLARTPEGVLLVPSVIPGERAQVLPEPLRRGVRRGQLVQVSEASADRVAAECPYFGRCGGCQHQHIAYARQLQLKQEILRECFERIGKLRLAVPIRVVPSEPWRYRNRVRLQVEKSASAWKVGYHEPSSHTLCAVDCCPISSPGLEAVIRELSRGALASLFPEGAAELELFAADADRSFWITVYSSQPAPDRFGEAWREALPAFASVCWHQRPSGKDTVWGEGAITYRVGEFHYRVSHRSFFQANRFLLEAMIEAAVGESTGGRALDLYAGAGFFTVPLARRFERVAAVESHASAARDLAANVGVAGTRVHSHQKVVESFLATTSHNWDLILADPPRIGLSKPVREHLGRLRPREFVYVSCDPTTLARDTAALVATGYEIVSMHLVDQFPQTFHIESVLHLKRSGS